MSQSGTSDNEEDENMEDADDGDADEGDADVEGDEENEENDEDEDAEDNLDQDTPTKSRPRQSHLGHTQLNARQTLGAGVREDGRRPFDKRDPDSRRPGLDTEPLFEPRGVAPATPTGYRPRIRLETLSAPTYDIVPTIAAPHSTSINTITATPDMRWVFSGGSDGWVRKFNWVDTANSKSMLTVAQRHPFVDSVTKAGVLMSYWENEDIIGKSARLESIVVRLIDSVQTRA